MPDLASIGAFALRNWQVVLAAGLALMLVIRTDQRDDARAALETEQARSAAFASSVSAAARSFQAQFQLAARDVERQQTQITEEVSRDYQSRISELRQRYADLLRRQSGAGAGAAGGPAGLPAPGNGAGRPDGAATDPGLSLAERYIATEQAIRLEALQEWVRRQAAVAPAAVPSSPAG